MLREGAAASSLPSGATGKPSPARRAREHTPQNTSAGEQEPASVHLQVGATGFEPATFWSRTRRRVPLVACPPVLPTRWPKTHSRTSRRWPRVAGMIAPKGGAGMLPRVQRRRAAASATRPPNSNTFSVMVVLPASGWEIIANVRRRAVSCRRSVMAVTGIKAIKAWIIAESALMRVHPLQEQQRISSATTNSYLVNLINFGKLLFTHM